MKSSVIFDGVNPIRFFGDQKKSSEIRVDFLASCEWKKQGKWKLLEVRIPVLKVLKYDEL